jgi:hypothetical protein
MRALGDEDAIAAAPSAIRFTISLPCPDAGVGMESRLRLASIAAAHRGARLFAKRERYLHNERGRSFLHASIDRFGDMAPPSPKQSAEKKENP